MLRKLVVLNTEDVINGNVLDTLHGECLSRGSLSISKYSNVSPGKNFLEYRLNCCVVEFFSRLVLIESVIKLKSLHVKVFGDTINF